MNAKQVLDRYAIGQRDFRGKDLRGQNLVGAELEGADFSGCDIRGANFKMANLTGAKFIEAKAGLQKRWLIASLIAALLIIVLFAFFLALAGLWVSYIFDAPDVLNQIIGWTCLIVLITFCWVIYRQGLVALSGALAGVLAIALSGVMAVAGAIAVSIAVAGPVAGFVALILAIVEARTVAIALAGRIAVAVDVSQPGAVSVAVAGIVAVMLCLFAAFLACRSLKGDPKDTWIRNFAIAFAATGGTCFFDANLTHADFTGANLKNTDLRTKLLTRTCFKGTIKLDFARVGNTLLAQPAVRDLLINPSSVYKKDYFKANLRGANLDGANLSQAHLKQADLSEATLKGANLFKANLTEANAVNADFTQARLTGACLEAWNIDHTTKFNDVYCKYVYLLEEPNAYGHRERRPHDPDSVFQPGDFAKLYRKMMDIVQFWLRDGINPTAFRQAFDQIIEANPEITYDSIQSYEKKGEDVLITVAVPENTNKGKVEQQFNESYLFQLEAVKTSALLESEKTHNATLTELLKLHASQSPTIINEPKAMNHSTDSSKTIKAGGDVKITDSVVNLADTLSEVTNAINQLPDTDNNLNEFKTLLLQLQNAIQTEKNLDDNDKTEALTQVKKIAEAAKTPDDSNLQRKAKTAVSFLEIIAKGLEPASELAQSFAKALPTIIHFFGF